MRHNRCGPGRVGMLVSMLLLAACTLPLPQAGDLVQGNIAPAAETPQSAAPDPAYVGQPYQDARGLFGGVCFDFWVAQVNRLFIIRSAQEHIAFYNEVDEAALCRFPVIREPFDFEAGRILLGAVNIGTGCQAVTTPLALLTDDAAQTVTLRVEWAVTGDCSYRLARPFWVSIPRPPDGYRVLLEFVTPPS